MSLLLDPTTTETAPPPAKPADVGVIFTIDMADLIKQGRFVQVSFVNGVCTVSLSGSPPSP